MIDYYSEFINWLKYERAVSPNTVSSYLSSLKSFVEFVQQKEANKITREDLAQWRAEVIKTMDINTARNRHSAIRTFFQFLNRKYGLPNLAREVLPPLREVVRDPTVPSEYEIEKIISRPDETTEIGMRDSAIMALLASTGIRVPELILLDFGDIQIKKDLFEMSVPREK